MIDQQQNDVENAELQPLAIRLKNMNWLIRKRAYEQILNSIARVKSINEEFNIQGEPFSVAKFIAFLNNLVEEKHPNVLLKGLQCAEAILRLDIKTGKHFNKLVVQGLQKFPLLTQQRKIVLEKFLEILELCKIEANTLINRLNLPQQKSVMFVIEVIGALEMTSLKGKLIQISKKHPKKDVKQLAAQIAEELGNQQPETIVKEQQVKAKTTTKGLALKKQEPKKAFKMELIEKIPQFEQLNAKQQQSYSQQLLGSIDQISALPVSGNLSSFCYYIQLMIEFNNQIISTNGVKMLTSLIKNKSQLINTSFPLLFIFRKFKTHKTHPTNVNLLNLIQALLCSNRSSDLMNAILQGLGCQQNKANLKYGCIVSFIRIFCYYYRHQQLFQQYCIGQYTDLFDKIENKRYVEKMILKCFDVFCKQNYKDKEYIPAIQSMKSTLGLTLSTTIPSQKSIKQVAKVTVSKSPMSRSNATTANQSKTQQIPKKNLASTKNTSKTSLISSPEGQLGKILELMESNKLTEASLNKAIQKCLEVTKTTLQQNVFDMFYYCEIAESFIEKYQPNEQTDEMISHFLIDYLKILSTAEIKPSKKNSKITETGLEYLLKLSTSKLVLSKQLQFILNNLLKSFGFQIIVRCLGNLYVMGRHFLKKKNKKYLMRWLEENASEEFVNSQYFEVIEAIQNNGEKQKVQKINIIQPPSIINLPTYQPTNPVIEVKQREKIPIQKKKQQEYQVTKPIKKHEPIPLQQIRLKSDPHSLQILQNADISKIEKVQQQYTDRLDEKWEYFLNKKGIVNNQHQIEVDKKMEEKGQFSEQEEQQKYNFTQNNDSISEIKRQRYYDHPVDLPEKTQKNNKDEPFHHLPKKPDAQLDTINNQDSIHKKEESFDEKSVQKDEQIHENQYSEQYDESKVSMQQEETEKMEYKFLNYEKIIYMINNSTNPFNHLRTLILIPFKSQPNKHLFLRQLTHIIQSQTLQKPQPFNSILLIIILLFTEIKTDKTIIESLQFLYEYMAQHCTNNEFLKIIISLYHSVIDQTQQIERKLLLTILTKSMTRIMPFVENALELLKDFQQFYQIGEMVYFEMFPDEYNQIKQVIQHSDSLEEVIHKAFEEEGESLIPIIEGWLQTQFKNVVKEIVENMIAECQEN